MLLLPIFGANRVPSCLNDYTFEGFDTRPHLLVELLLHGVQVVVYVLAEADQETKGLHDGLWRSHVLLVHCELDDSVSVLFATYAWESSYKFSRRVLVMIGCCDGAWDVSCRFFELEEHDSRHADVGLVEEVEREVE